MATATTQSLDTSFHKRRLAEDLADPEFRAEYERARAQIAQIDEIMNQLDHLREESGFSKAELARQIGKTPSSVRRLFTAAANPELKTIAAMATALDAEIRIVPHASTQKRRSRRRRQKNAEQNIAA